MEIVGNEIYNTVMRNQWWQSDYWDAAVSSHPTKRQWSWKLIGNSIHDSYGECADVLAVDGATIEGNKIYNCVSTNVFVSNSQNVTINRNWVSANTDRYDRPEYGYRATGIQLANEGSWAGWSLRNVRITNNIVEWVSQGIRYWHSRSGGDIHDTYGGLYVGFNTVNRTQFSPLRFDTPDGWWPASGSRLRQNSDPQHQRKQLVLDRELGLVDRGWELELQQRNVVEQPGDQGHLGHVRLRVRAALGSGDSRERGPLVRVGHALHGLQLPVARAGELEHARGNQLSLPRHLAVADRAHSRTQVVAPPSAAGVSSQTK